MLSRKPAAQARLVWICEGGAIRDCGAMADPGTRSPPETWPHPRKARRPSFGETLSMFFEPVCPTKVVVIFLVDMNCDLGRKVPIFGMSQSPVPPFLLFASFLPYSFGKEESSQWQIHVLGKTDTKNIPAFHKSPSRGGAARSFPRPPRTARLGRKPGCLCPLCGPGLRRLRPRREASSSSFAQTSRSPR